LVNIQGRSRSVEENKLIIQFIAYELRQDNQISEVLKKCVDAFGGRYLTYKTIWDNYINNGSLLPDCDKRGFESSKLIFEDVFDLDDNVLQKFFEFTWNYNIFNNTGFSKPDLAHFFSVEMNIELSNDVIDQLLGYYNFEWTNVPVYYGCEYSEQHKKNLARFCFMYSQALQFESKGTHKLVCSDESWSNTSFEDSWMHRCLSYTNDCEVCSLYVKLSSGDCKTSIQKKNRGERCIFLHAFSREKLLVGYDETEKTLQKLTQHISSNLDVVLPTSEFVMECKNDEDGDYHKQMNSDIYDKWFTNRLIPSFEQLYPDKKGIFFIDQAPFHINRVAFPSSNCNKDEILEHYRLHNINTITIQRKDGDMANETITFHIDSFLKNKRNKNALQGGPSKEEMLLYLWKYLEKNNPIALEPKIAKQARARGHIVLYGCQNYPFGQPFELFNAYVKMFVKKRNKRSRTISELYNDILDGMYGGKSRVGRSHKAVDTKLITGWFKKCEAYIENDMKIKLGYNNKNLNSLWDNQCQYDIEKPFIQIPWTDKTLKEWSTLFDVCLI
jgi:hypothetical protein